MGLSPGRVKPKTITLVFTASLLHCVLMVIFPPINNYLSPQIIEHKKKKNANRPGLGQTQKCGCVKRIQVTSAPNIVIWAPR
jgi:hypothetical protein